MARIDFALWDAVGGYSGATSSMADIYDEHIALARELDAAGWHSYFVIEHQNSPLGRITAPTVYLTAVARATQQLRIGAMMWQLPFYHPIRLAQEVAMLDQLSRGRVEFGTGIGVHEHEFIRWDVDYYQRAAMAGEVLDIVKQAWTKDEVTFEGKYFRFNEALPQPKPYQKPYPPIWAAVHSDPAVEFAARNNYHVAQNLDTDEVIARKFDLYRKIWKECGPLARESYEFNIEHGLAIVGSPETVIRRLEEGRRRIGYDIFCTNHEIGHMPPDLVRNSIRLFGKEVVPAFKS
jgi:alkanesulfonate monooxygenase SsuD/methylene tetrahydromethanopterin reductase-like flavin-dependent oxidoreductase (luciferase family)